MRARRLTSASGLACAVKVIPNSSHDSGSVVTNNHHDDNKKNSTWLISKPTASSSNNPRMYVLQIRVDNVTFPENDEFYSDNEDFRWKFDNHVPHNDNNDEIFKINRILLMIPNLMIHEFLISNGGLKIVYNEEQFLVRESYGYSQQKCVFSWGFIVILCVFIYIYLTFVKRDLSQRYLLHPIFTL